MKYGLTKPCKSCPFVVANDFPLHPERIKEIADSEFSCHNTVTYDPYDDFDDDHERDTRREHHCFGHLVIQWAQYNGFNNVAALAARLGMFDPHSLPTTDEVGCFATFEDYIYRERKR